jgi:osmotically-inducible protein OsmY
VPVASNGKIVGIVSRANLIQALVNLNRAKTETSVDDLTLHSNILEQLRSKPWVDPTPISILVNNGSVELWGIVDSETEKNAIRVAVEVTPGVRQVANKLVVEHLMNVE